MRIFAAHIIFWYLLGTASIILAQTGDSKIDPNGFNVFYYENGIKSSEGYMKDGKPDGYWKNYYKNGVIKNEGNRKNFQLDSIWKFYSEKGKITKSITYANGKKNGFTLNYDTAQRITSRENFVNDIKEGNTFLYYPNGKLKQIIPFKKNKADGISYEFSVDSVITGIIIYKYGFIEKAEKINRTDEKGNKQGVWKEFYDDGRVKKEMQYKDGAIDGYVKEYDKKGDLQEIKKFDFGKEVKNAPELAKLDVFKAFYDDGTVRYEGGYINGVPVGTHYHYKKSNRCDSIPFYDDSLGMQKKFMCFNVAIPDSAIIFQDGYLIEKGPVDSLRQRQKEWVEYNISGEFRSKGIYVDDKRIGDWVFYYPNGKIEQKGKYDKKGRAQGEWNWYYESGKLLRKEIYLNDKREGLMEEFSEDGKLIAKGEYIDDQKEGPWYYEMMNYKEYGVFRNGEPDSIWKAYYIKENKLRFEGQFTNGDPSGKHTYYYDNGTIQCTGRYVGGLKDGDWKYFDANGFLVLTVTYENGIERKFDGIKITPTYEDALKVFDEIKSAADKRITEKQPSNNTGKNQDE